jgi:hypothetical protein
VTFSLREMLLRLRLFHARKGTSPDAPGTSPRPACGGRSDRIQRCDPSEGELPGVRSYFSRNQTGSAAAKKVSMKAL